MKSREKAAAIKIVTECAKLYQEHLANRKLLFIVTDKHKRTSALEVSFDETNYLHLTGLKVHEGLSARKFYEKCLDGKLSEADFEMESTTEKKLRVLPMMMCKSLRVDTVGEYNHQKPVLYTEKLAGSVKGCMGFVEDEKSKRYVPNTLLEADIRDCIKTPYRIVATFRKRKEEAEYKEVVYVAKKVDWDKVEFPAEDAALYSLLKRE